VSFRRRAHERDVAVLGQHDQMSAREQHLSMAVAAALPFQRGCRVDGRENRVVEAVHEPVVQNRRSMSAIFAQF